MGLYLLDYGAGNVQSLANSLTKLGHKFTWITAPDDFHKATVSLATTTCDHFSLIINRASSFPVSEPLNLP